MTQATLTTCIFRISSVAYHNSHINTIFVNLFMQELFVDKIHFFKYLSMSDKPRMHRLKIVVYNSTRRIQYKLPWLHEYFHPYRDIPSRKGKYPLLRTKTKPHQLIKHAKISYSIVAIVFRKFSSSTYRKGLNRVTQSWGTLSTSKSTNLVSLVTFVGNLHFSILLHRVRYLKNLFMSRR